VHISMIFTISKSHDFTQSCRTWQEMKLKIRFIIFVYSIKSCNHMLFVFIKKGSPVYVVPACAGSGKGPTTLGLTYGTFPCILQEAVSKT
jgi:hypothetical protein